jgi:DNA-binding NtrC family response regulator
MHNFRRSNKFSKPARLWQQILKTMSKLTGKLLIIDDNTSVLNSLELFLKYHFEKILTLKNPNLIPSFLEKEPVDVMLLDMNFTAGVNTGNEGIYWLSRILEMDPQAVVVMITAYGDIDLAVKAIREGAFDFITKPWDNNKLLATLQAALQLRFSKKEVKKLRLKEKHEGIDVQDQQSGQNRCQCPAHW